LDYKNVQSKWIRGLYTYLLTISQERLHAFERNLLILEGIGIKEGRRFIDIRIPEEIQREADLFFEEKIPYPDHPLLGIYAGANYKSRCWRPEKFAQLIDKLNEDLDLNCLLLWLPGELDLIKSIEREMQTVPIRAYAARGKSLLALIKRCNLLISADSALIQMANIAKVPVLGLFGPSSPQKTGPIGPDDKVIQGSLSCVPCEKLYCSNPLCMQTIQVDKVVYIVEKMLSKKFKFKRLE
jgi:ADP-heptose:LPS heptosyltransferase